MDMHQQSRGSRQRRDQMLATVAKESEHETENSFNLLNCVEQFQPKSREMEEKMRINCGGVEEKWMVATENMKKNMKNMKMTMMMMMMKKKYEEEKKKRWKQKQRKGF